MKKFLSFGLIVFLTIFILTSCNNSSSNKTTAKEMELQKKELELKEKELDLRERELNAAKLSTPKIEQVKNNQQTNTVDNSLAYLQQYNNKYPIDVNLFEKDPLKSRLLKLLGSKYTLFVNNIKTQTPIAVEGQNIFTSGCFPHNCGYDESAIGIDIRKDVIFIGILSSSKLQIYSENSKVAMPSKFKLWVANFQPTPVAEKNVESKYTSTGSILSLEFQGNNYVTIKILTSNSNKVSIWCTSGETTVYKNNLQTTWNLEKGMKIGVNGTWEVVEGEKQLNAKRIDILQ